MYIGLNTEMFRGMKTTSINVVGAHEDNQILTLHVFLFYIQGTTSRFAFECASVGGTPEAYSSWHVCVGGMWVWCNSVPLILDKW